MNLLIHVSINRYLADLLTQVSIIYITLAAILPSIKTETQIDSDKIKEEIKNNIQKSILNDSEKTKLSDNSLNRFEKQYINYFNTLKEKNKLPIYTMILATFLWIVMSVFPFVESLLRIYLNDTIVFFIGLFFILLALSFLFIHLIILIGKIYLLNKQYDLLIHFPKTVVPQRLKEEIQRV